MRKLLLLLCLGALVAPCVAQDTSSVSPLNYEQITRRASFSGGDIALKRYIAAQTKYPEEALEQGIEGIAKLTFTIDRDGNAVKIESLDTSVNRLLIDEAKRVIGTTNGMWSPALNKGQKVNMIYSVPFIFELVKDEEPALIESKQGSMEKISMTKKQNNSLPASSDKNGLKINGSDADVIYEYYEVSQEAVFGNGKDQLLQNIVSNLKYPLACLEKGETGTVILSFVINEKGETTHIEQINDEISPLLVTEAKRVLRLTSGNWKPAKKDGVLVPMRSIIPIKFEIF